MEYLLAQPGTAYMKDAAEIEGRGADSISEEVGETLKLLEAIRRDAVEKAGSRKRSRAEFSSGIFTRRCANS